MDPFRGFLKIKIKQGEVGQFQALIHPFVETVQATEPAALQFEAYVNEQTREIIWLESYSANTDFDFHIGNPALNDLKMQMMPLQESIVDMYFMSAPTQPALAGLQQYGINPTVLDPWPGSIRLTEAREENANIQVCIVLDLSDMAAYRALSDRIEAIAQQQAGVLFHRSYQASDSRVVILEEHLNSAHLLAWAEASENEAKELGSLITNMTCQVCGTPSPSCKTFLDKWGATYFQKVAGFERYA